MILAKLRVFASCFKTILCPIYVAFLFSQHKNSKQTTTLMAGECSLSSVFISCQSPFLLHRRPFCFISPSEAETWKLSVPFPRVCTPALKVKEPISIMSPDVCVQRYCY